MSLSERRAPSSATSTATIKLIESASRRSPLLAGKDRGRFPLAASVDTRLPLVSGPDPQPSFSRPHTHRPLHQGLMKEYVGLRPRQSSQTERWFSQRAPVRGPHPAERWELRQHRLDLGHLGLVETAAPAFGLVARHAFVAEPRAGAIRLVEKTSGVLGPGQSDPAGNVANRAFGV